MTNTQTLGNSDVEQIRQRVEQLRRSFDEGIQHAPPEETTRTEEYLLTTLAGETYAYPVSCALEIVQVPRIVPVPDVPAAVLGVINFRGQVLSVATIHGLLGLRAGEPNATSRIIVTKGLRLNTGILVDSVERIVEVVVDDIQPVPVTIGDSKGRLLAGQMYVDGRTVFFLDLKQLCTSESLRVHSTGSVRVE